jgi:hypothetical protein
MNANVLVGVQNSVEAEDANAGGTDIDNQTTTLCHVPTIADEPSLWRHRIRRIHGVSYVAQVDLWFFWETARRFIVYQAASFGRNNGSLATRVQCPPCRLMNGLNSNVECGEGLRFPSRESPRLYMLRTIVPPASFAREQHKITEEARCDLLNT